jgi:nicotinate-nucleotide adenylyltransferase
VHLGHTTSARAVAERFDLDRTLLVLSARPPHKAGAQPADANHRLAMLEIAAASNPGIEASDIEMRRSGPSYTVDTLQQILRGEPAAQLFLILGIDAYAEVDSWSRPEALLELANIVVTTRPGHAFPPDALRPPVAGAEACCYDEIIRCFVHNSGHVLTSCEVPDVDVSASRIRQRLADGESIEDLTGPAVSAYIHQHGLYGARTA